MGSVMKILHNAEPSNRGMLQTFLLHLPSPFYEDLSL